MFTFLLQKRQQERTWQDSHPIFEASIKIILITAHRCFDKQS
jgi:hypothetical protein